ncbi:MAG TPA: hypothetical protein VF092_29315 [Longimicrobium sp.]
MEQALARLLRDPAPATPALRRARLTELDVAIPHPVYHVGLSDLAAGRLTAAARLVAWRYLLLDGERVIAAAEVTAPGASGRVELTHFNEGPFVKATVDALSLAEQAPQVAGAAYEFRSLRIPALYVASLWLHASDDLFIPLPPTHEKLEALRVYTEEQLITELRTAAADRLKIAEDSGGPEEDIAVPVR